MSKHTVNIEWNGQEIEVHFYFTKGYEGRYFALPEDCYEGVDDEWELDSIMYKGIDVMPLFSEEDLDAILIELQESIEYDTEA